MTAVASAGGSRSSTALSPGVSAPGGKGASRLWITRTPAGRLASISSMARATPGASSGAASERVTTPGRLSGSSARRMSFSRTPGRVVSAATRAPTVARPPASRARVARPRSSASLSSPLPRVVGSGFAALSMPKIGRWMTVIARAGTTPAAAATVARTGASTDSEPRWSVRSSTVAKTAAGGSAVDKSVPAGMKTSAAAGVARAKTTVPVAKVRLRRVSPRSATSWSRSRPPAVARKPAR